MISDCPTVEAALQAIAGAPVEIASTNRVPGGCIANGRRVELTTGQRYFVKQGTNLPLTMFGAEAAGLEALRAARGPRVPEPLAYWEGSGTRFLITEFVETGPRRSGFFDRLGRELAHLHCATPAERFGFVRNNYIGSTPQDNTWNDSWCDFFAERRLAHQIQLAADTGRADRAMVAGVGSIISRIAQLVPEPVEPALLHGDLWSGNQIPDENGDPVLIDPAVYYGHPEADLAMTELFGGFGPGFLSGYNEVSPIDAGYSGRRDLYNLYHLLNHLNLFGAGYAGQVRSVIQRYR